MAWYFGIDLDETYAQISVYTEQMKEPQTLSQKEGSSVFVVPYHLLRHPDGQWEIGWNALQNRSSDYFWEENIYETACKGADCNVAGEKIEGAQLFALFIQELCQLTKTYCDDGKADKIIFTVSEVGPEQIQLVHAIAEKLPVAPGGVHLRDYRECFANYALAQQAHFWRNGVQLYAYDGKRLRILSLERKEEVRPVVVLVHQTWMDGWGSRSFGRKISDEAKDQLFCEILKEQLEEQDVSTIYLVGEGFEGDWLKESLEILCDGHRAFLGQNLFTKGACLTGAIEEDAQWPFVYLGDAKPKANVCLNVSDCGKPHLISLVSAGDNWYEAGGEMEILLEDGNRLDVLLKAPDGSESRVQTFTLKELPKRPERTTRLLLQAKAESETRIRLVIQDLGFGELFPSCEEQWEYEINI